MVPRNMFCDRDLRLFLLVRGKLLAIWLPVDAHHSGRKYKDLLMYMLMYRRSLYLRSKWYLAPLSPPI